jgi:histidinol dehydrogenase
VAEAIRAHLPALPRREIVEAALRQRGLNGVVADLESAVALANRVAPEHLQVMVEAEAGLQPEDFVAGAIFWGPHSPTAVGDYWAGPNHVLPTGGTARFRGPLGVDDFLVATSLVHYSAQAARRQLGPAIGLARAERLPAHAEALAARGRDERDG